LKNGFDVSDEDLGLSDPSEGPEGTIRWHYRGETVAKRAESKRNEYAGLEEKPVILVVDDDSRLCDSLAALLRVVGYDVVNVYSGFEALAAAELRVFDAAVIDIELPDVDGTEVLKGLLEADPELGTLILSGNATLECAIESLNLGADAFVMKPADPDVLLEKLVKVARLKRLHRGSTDSEASYRALFENIGDGAFQSDLEGNYTAINRAGAEILGFEEPGRLIDGRLKAWETYSSRDEYDALMMRTIRDGEVRQALRRFRKRNGTLGWLETTLRARRGAGGRVVGFEGIFRDVTDRIRYQEMLEALYALWADLGEAKGVEEIGGLTLDFLRAILEIEMGGFVVVNGDVITWMGVESGGRESRELPVSRQRVILRAVRTGEVQMVSDTRQDRDCDSFWVDGEGVLSLLVVPIKMSDEVVSVIEIGGARPHAFSDEDRKLVEIVGEHVRSALDRLVKSKFDARLNLRLSDFK
jgi:PAS domain S-box-containing protein